MGWAVVYLTIILRVVLLPFSLIDEYNRVKNEALYKEIKGLEKVYQNDQILLKQEIRRVMKKRRVQPWAKMVVLGIQLLVLVLLYQVFISGIRGNNIVRILYPSVTPPSEINTNFYGFELGMKNDIIWAGAVGLFLLIEIYLKYRRLKGGISKSDLTYFILFPLFVAVLLWMLPMVKSLFVFTSIAFSAVMGGIMTMFFQDAMRNKANKTNSVEFKPQ